MAELSPAYLHDTVLLFFLVAVCRHHLIGRERPPLIHALENRRGENKKPLLSALFLDHGRDLRESSFIRPAMASPPHLK
ncbi:MULTISPECIES: hypothetical protein [Bacillus]|uniref:Uncharacterized protein n=1 Tax=Bacillus glycinifermentans TaxID=1664069 RepID=A0AAJ3YYL8_9BACI|nr:MULTISPECIES: hypothetical protein [Bacillus]MDU0071429.1 hypothetical protein [Bacillus sp. IG6]MED8019271.1 hypothetical protein [Bacillus glycinifermentans]QAT65542.1 hypothetical protein EQZ20_11915 [Bacillus glycinifermentans]WKB79551.1 hypothetical protein QYM22_12205 [Bacillus glycinifermentans]